MSGDEEPRVLYDKRDHVAHVTMNRPAVLDAMDLPMHREPAFVWDDVEWRLTKEYGSPCSPVPGWSGR